MKESKKREDLSSKRRKHCDKLTKLETWDQTDLEDADEKALEKRLHQLKLQLQMAQDEPLPRISHHSSKKQKNRYSPDDVTSESDASESASSISNVSSATVRKYKSIRRSSSYSDDEPARPRSSRSAYKKQSKQVHRTRMNTNTNNDRSDTRVFTRRKISPTMGKRSSRIRSRKSPSLDKRDLYNRLDTDRWHDKAKEFEKERNIKSRNETERDRSRGPSRTERGQKTSVQREITRIPRNNRTTSTKRTALIRSSAVRRKESLESTTYRTRATAADAAIISYDNASRRPTIMSRKLSPKDERLGRYDDRRIETKIIRRNDNRTGDVREPVSRLRDFRDRKDRSLSILAADKSRDYRDPLDHNARSDHRERVKTNDDRFKERDVKRVTVHDRLGPRTDARDTGDNNNKFRRLSSELSVRIGSGKEIAPVSILQRHPAGGAGLTESVFDRMRNRYNDRKNIVAVTACERDRLLAVETNGLNRLPLERRRNFGTLVLGTRPRSPLINRDCRESEKANPVPPDKRILSPANSRKSRDSDGRGSAKRRNTEEDNTIWSEERNKTNQVRSRSRSSERRKRRRSSQEEWRVIDMTSPIDDQFSDETNRTYDSAVKLKRSISSRSKLSQNNETYDDDESKKKMKLTDELSDISDEDFTEVNANNFSRNRKDGKLKTDSTMLMVRTTDSSVSKIDQRSTSDQNTIESTKCSLPSNQQNAFSNEMDVLIAEQKNIDEDTTNTLSTTCEKVSAENIDSEEETVSRVSDALGVDWTDFVEESKRKRTVANCDQEMTADVRRRWNTTIILTKVGISAKYAGEDVFDQVRKDAEAQYVNELPNVQCSSNGRKIVHEVPALHSCLNNKIGQKLSLFEPYKTAISARKDIILRRKLCGLPVKNSYSQHIIGICHWII